MSQLTSPRRGGVRRSFALLAAIVFAVFAGRAGAQTIALQSAQVLDTSTTAITAVALAPNGDLYVAEGTNGIMYYPANGASAAVTGLSGGANVTALVAGPAGDVFAADAANKVIYKISAGALAATSAALSVAPTALGVSGAFVFFDQAGTGLFSTDTAALGTPVQKTTDTAAYTAMAIDKSGNIFVATASSLFTAGTSSSPTAGAGLTPTGIGTMTSVSELAADGSGNLYVADASGSLQLVTAPTGADTAAVVSSGASGYPGVAVGARNNVYWAQNASGTYTVQVRGAVNFRGQNMHATSGAITLTYIVSGGSVTFNGTNPYVVYDGGGNDFAVTGSTCTGTVSTACTILVTFTPNDRPGLRRGSLVLLDGSNKQLAVTYLRGYAVGPGAAMNYYADSTNAFFLSRKFNMTPTFTTSTGPIGITVNALPNAGNPLNSGNIYTSNYGTTSPYTSNVTDFNFGANTGAAALTDVSGFASSNISLATDASGDLYVASNTATSVTLVPNENGTLNVTDKVTNGTNLGTNLQVWSASDSALAVDAYGNVYVAVSTSGGSPYGVVEIPAGSNSGTAYTVMSGLGNPLYGVAVDASGNVYTADASTIYVAAPTGPGTWGSPSILTFTTTKLTASGGQIKAGPALDASGNLYVAGSKTQTWVRFPSTGGSGTAFNIAGLFTTGGLAVDAEGGVYFTTNGGATGAARGYDQYDDPSANTSTSGLSGKAFGSVNVGSSDASAPGGTYVGAIFNTGNQNLVITSVANSDATDFSFGTSNTCTATGLTLNPGQSCLVYVVFNPKSPATFNDTVTFTDNANNGTNVTQTLWAASGHTITGTGVATATKLVYPNAAPVAMVGGNFGTVAVDLDNSGGFVQNVSSPNVTIAVTGPSGFAGCTSAATAPVAGEASVALTSCVPTVAGSYTLTATVPGNSLTLATETATVYNSASAGSTTVGVAANATVTFNFSSTVAVNSVVATSAAGGGAFTALGTGTCTTNGLPHTYNAGNSCTVNYTFTPSNPGLSRGAITLYSSINAPLAAVFVNGTGTGPLPAYAVPAVASIGSSLTNISGLAAWGSGFYAATVGGNLEQITAGGSVTTICSTCLDANPSVDQSVAVDGAGNVYSVASDPANGTQTIWEFTNKNGTLSTVPGAYASNLNVGTTAEPGLLAVDGSGNLFAALPGANTIVEYPATNPAITPTGVTIATGLTSPHGLALDPSGDLFFTGAGGLLKEITAAQIAGALPASPASVGTANITGGDFNATDANGDIYTLTGTGDKLLTQYLNSAGFTGTPANTYTFAGTISVVATGLSISQGGGHVTIADSANATLDQLTSYNVPTGSNSPFAFGVINVNATNGPNNLVLENIGNAGLTLTGTPALASGTQFNTTGTTCSTGAIAAGSTCTLAATFAPTKPGPLSDSFNVNFPAGFIIGAVPAAPGLSGTGTGTPSVTVSTISNSTYGSTPNPTVTVACSGGCSGSPTPTGTVAWKLNGSVQTPVSLVSGVATLNVNVPNNLAAGNNQTVEVTAYSSGDSNYTNIAEGSITNAGPQTFNVAQKGLDLTGLSVMPKTYDGTTTATLTGSAAIQGGEVIGGDSVSVTGTPVGAFNVKDTSATSVAVSGLSLTGAQAANYSLNSYTINATISKKGLDLTGLSVSPKTYDGSTTAALTGSAAIQGGEVIGGDTVSVTGAPVGAFNVKDTSATSVAVSGLSLTGAQSGDYSLNAYSIPASGKISAKAVDLTGLAVSAKTYDGTTTAALTGSAAIQGGEVIGGDSVSVTGTATGTFNFKDVPTATTVTVSGLSLTGAQAADYTPNAYTIAATISAKGLDATGLAVTPKTYDDTTTATLTGTAAIQGGEVIGGDAVNLTGTPAGAFNVKDTSATSVAVSGLSLTGAQSGDYSLNAYSIPASGKISAKAVDLAGLAVSPKTYDGTTTAALTGTAAVQGGEVFGGDTVNVTGTPAGTFNSKDVATATTVTVSGLSLTGAQAGDYTPNAYTISATINPVTLTITASSPSTPYGTVAAVTAGYSGFVGGDSASSLTTAPTCVSNQTTASTVNGAAPVTSCSGAVDANYTFTYVPGTVSINPAPLTITASNASMIVGGTVPAIAPIYSGFVAGDTSASLTTAPTCTTDTFGSGPVTSATAVGVYQTLCSGAADSNYAIGYNAGTISVTPAPVVAPATAVGASSATFTVTFAFTAPSTTVASVGVYSYGQSGKDFTSTDAANCGGGQTFGTGSHNTSCAVDVTFTPQAPGLRLGAVVLYDGSGNPIPGQTIAISGVGQAPVAIYPVSNGVSTLGSGLTAPAAMATDATGDFFIADGDVIREIPAAGGAASSSIYGVGAPITGITVDGAGNIYIAEASTHEVFKVVNGATGLQTGSVSPIVNDSVSLPGAMAADGAGNVYYVDGNTNTVVELLQAGGTATLGTGLVTSTAITLDASGNLYIADNGANSGAGAIYEVPAGGGTQTTFASGTAAGMGGAITQMATDAAGNVYATGPSGLALFSPGSSSPVMLNSGNDTGLAVGGNGLVTFSTSGAAGLSQMNLAAAPASLAAFPATQALSDSAASALQIFNIGNLPLTFNLNPSVVTSEFNASTSTCSTSNTVAPGNDCNVNVVFTPTAAAIWTDAVGISTNSLNATTTASVLLSGTGTAIPQVITGFDAPAPVTYSATPITIQGVTGGASGQPVTFSLVSGPATLSGTNNGTITTTGVGTVTIQASQAGTTDGSGNTIYAAATAVQQSLTVNQAALTVTGATVAPKTYNGQVNDAVIGGTPVLNGIVGSDVVTLGGTPTGVYANANAGDTVGVTVSGYTLGGANAANYTLTQPSLTGVINKAPATITGAAVNSKVYDGTATATLGTTIGLGGILPADTNNVSPAGTPVATFAQTGVGTAIPVTVTGYALAGSAAGNYVLSQPTGLTANITAAPLTVTASNATRAFGAANPTFSATITGFVNNETAAVVTGAAAMTTTATATSDPGTFAITPALGSLAAANYSFMFVNGTLTVTQASQTITFPTIPSTVPGSQVTLQATSSSGLPVSYTIISGSATLSGSTLSVTGPGTITVKASQAGNIDYSAATAVSQSFSAGAPAVTLGGNFNSSSQLVFGTQATGTTSTAQTVTVTNSGSAPLVVSTATAEAPFAASTTCATVAAGASCSISVTFNPTAAGNASGTLTITDSASTSPQTVTLIGTGVAPGVALAPNALGFGSVALGSASVAQSLTITNTGSATLHVSQVAATGDFAVAGSCSAIPAGGACSVAVTFTPTAAGNRSGTITVSDDASGGTQTVNASGFGATAGALVGPGAATFPPQVVGTTSFPQAVTLTNTGTAALTGVSIGVSGSFSESSTSCGATVAAGASCAINVVFKPTLAGATNGSVQVTDNLGTQAAALSGTGLQAGANLSATVLYFGTQLTGTSSNGQTVTLTNSGTAALAITSIAASTGFTATSNCLSPTLGTGSLAAGSSCNINVSFAPGATGIQIGTLTVVDGAGTQTASTAGIGVAPGLILSTSSAQFGSVEVGSNSLAQTLTITNSGSVGLTLDAPLVAGDFAATDNCPSPLQPGATCQLSVLFTPTAVGSRSGTVQITAPDALAVAMLSGTGTLPGISASPAALFFGGDAVGTASAAQTITVTNTGSAALTVNAVTATGDFSASGTCANQTLAAGATCVINAVLTPTTIGTRTGAISIYNNANGVQTVALSGVGQSATATLAPTALAFGSQPVSSGGTVTLTGKPQTVTLSNNGNVALAISGITISGDFAQSNTCGASLAAGAACSISVSFNPTGLNQRTGTLTLNDNAGSQTLALNGVGSPTGLVLTPSVLNFGGTTVGQTTTAQTVTVSNGTGQAVNNLQIVASGEFAQSNTCGTSIATGASCTISITLTPATAGAVTGSIAINGALGGVGSGAEGLMRPNAANPSRQMLAAVALGASGNPAAIQLSSATLSFSSEPVGTASAAQTVTITNSGATDSLTALTVTSTPDFPITTTCGATLAAGATCTVSATFKPTAAGARTGAITIAATAGSSNLQAQVALSGQATGGVLTATPSSLVFPSQATATTSAAQTVTLTNTGGAALNISAIALSGSDFTLAASTCGTLPQALASGASYALSVTYAPAAPGASTGSITITSDGGTAVVALSGTASNAGLVLSSTAVNFGSVGVGITGTKTVTLTNSGTAAVAISSITASSGFAESNNCGASVAAGATCTVTVTYTPSAAGSNSGTLVVQDAAGAQQATLSGSATNYTVGAASATSATVGSGGGTATFSLQYTPGAFTGTVSIGCSGVPANATCTVNPSSLALTAGGAASTVQVSITTAGRSLVPPVAPPTSTPRMPLLWLLALALFLAGLAAALKLAPANKRRQAVLGAVIWGAMLAAGCGGVSNLPTAGNGTPAGTYVISVTSRAGSATQVTNFTLTVD